MDEQRLLDIVIKSIYHESAMQGMGDAILRYNLQKKVHKMMVLIEEELSKENIIRHGAKIYNPNHYKIVEIT